jgi:23S rRNA-/tRNA-specific pseudouridylate synthase
LVVELDGQTHFGKEEPDRVRQTAIEAEGYKVLRFWNSDVYERLDSVLRTIWNECNMKSGDNDPSPPTPLPGGARGELLQILLDTPTLLAINKPPGINVHEAPGPGGSALRKLRAQHGLNELTPVHRIDKDASGVLLFAKNKKAASDLQKVWEHVEKTYIALCENFPADGSGVVDAPILENQTGKPERLKNALKYFKEKNPGVEIPPLPEPKTSGVHPAGRTSQTEYRVLQKFERDDKKFCLIEVKPQQGRMHQIRVHLAHINCPIVGDRLYNADGATLSGMQRLALHAWKLVFPDCENAGAMISVEAPVADDIKAAIK